MEKYPIIGLLYIGLCSYTDLLVGGGGGLFSEKKPINLFFI